MSSHLSWMNVLLQLALEFGHDFSYIVSTLMTSAIVVLHNIITEAVRTNSSLFLYCDRMRGTLFSRFAYIKFQLNRCGSTSFTEWGTRILCVGNVICKLRSLINFTVCLWDRKSKISDFVPKHLDFSFFFFEVHILTTFSSVNLPLNKTNLIL